MMRITIYCIVYISLLLNGAIITNAQKSQELIEYEYLLVEGERNLFLGNLETAMKTYQACILTYPQGSAAYYRLSIICSLTRRQKDAEKYAAKAYTIDEANIFYIKNYVYSLLQNGKNTDAIKICKEQINTEHRKDALLMLVDSYELNRDFGNALKTLELVKSEFSDSEEILKKKAGLLIGMKSYDIAEKLIIDNLSNVDNPYDFYWLLVELYDKKNEYEKAQQYILKIKEINPNDVKVNNVYGRFLIQGSDSTEICENIKKLLEDKVFTDNDKIQLLYLFYKEDSVKYYNVIEKLKLDTIIDKRIIYLGNAAILTNQGKFEPALLDLKYIYEKTDDYDALKSLLDILQYFRRFDEIIRYSGNGMKKYNDKIELYYVKGYSEYMLASYDSAISTFEDALLKTEIRLKEKIAIMEILAEAYYKIGKHTMSDFYYDEVLKLDEYNIVARNNYAYFLSLRDKNLEFAKKLSEYTIKKEPEQATYLDTYAWILYKMGNYSESLIYIEKALKYNKENSQELYDHYGDILLKNGKTKKAISSWKKAIQYGGKKDSIQKKIQENE